MIQPEKYRINFVRDYPDVALLISPEKRFIDGEEDSSASCSAYMRRLFFWTAAESEEDMIIDCIYEKNYEITINRFSAASNKYDIAFLGVINAYNEDLDGEELWINVSKNLCKKIYDLLAFAGESIKNKSAREGDMILWSTIVSS